MPTNNKTPASEATANAAIVLPDEPDETLIQNRVNMLMLYNTSINNLIWEQLQAMTEESTQNKEKERVVHLSCKPGETWMPKYVKKDKVLNV